MATESGNVSINTENIFPIIKKWLYSEKDIFIRELVSNCSDAINKHKKLATIGEAAPFDPGGYVMAVIIEKSDKRLSFVDNGIGMTADEIKKYINQIAFSGAQDFLEKYKDKINEEEQIIGHFGLGFYSSFMAADSVSIDTLSYLDGAEAVQWTSVGGMDYEMGPSGRVERGTTVTLTMADDSLEYLDAFKIREVLRKYCAFMPYPIIVADRDQEAQEAEEAEKKASEQKEKAGADAVDMKATEADDDTDADDIDGEALDADDGGDGEALDADDIDDEAFDADDIEGEALEAGDGAASKKVVYGGREYEPVNDVSPLWQKTPRDCTDDEYKAFYRSVFMDFEDPLFWIHLNMDYPFNLKGILYFPKLRHEFETMEGQIKLYYNQVFVADNIKEVIPEFLLLLKGCLDCPDLPLNVSRSFLQNDSYVKRISTHITKKVGDKLTSLFETARDDYEKYWDDINPFIKYGCIREDNLYERVKDIIIYKNLDNKYLTLKTYLENAKSKHENTVFYVTDEKQQAQYIKIFRDNEMDAVELKTMLDTHFIQFLESKDRSVKMQRIDSDISDSLKAQDDGLSKDDADKMEKALDEAFKRAAGNDQLKIKLEALKTQSVPGVILLSEYSRRMRDMSRAYGAGGGMDMSAMFPRDETLVLNRSSKLIQSVAKLLGDGAKTEEVDLICKHVYDMAVLGNQQLEPSAMTEFLERSGQLLEKLIG
ncbi:MAG: molecular chaperone HtpG [Oscillospiraceae bacterium]|nr:molecular chaperone HtpG [Oscillospiraceae bacterium]